MACMTTPRTRFLNPQHFESLTMQGKGFVSQFQDVWMLDGVRTPMVDYCGALGHVSPTDLGIKAARAVLLRAGVSAQHIDSVIAGNMAPGDFDQFVLPRHIGLYAGVPTGPPAGRDRRASDHHGGARNAARWRALWHFVSLRRWRPGHCAVA